MQQGSAAVWMVASHAGSEGLITGVETGAASI